MKWVLYLQLALDGSQLGSPQLSLDNEVVSVSKVAFAQLQLMHQLRPSIGSGYGGLCLGEIAFSLLQHSLQEATFEKLQLGHNAVAWLFAEAWQAESAMPLF